MVVHHFGHQFVLVIPLISNQHWRMELVSSRFLVITPQQSQVTAQGPQQPPILVTLMTSHRVALLELWKFFNHENFVNMPELYTSVWYCARASSRAKFFSQTLELNVPVVLTMERKVPPESQSQVYECCLTVYHNKNFPEVQLVLFSLEALARPDPQTELVVRSTASPAAACSRVGSQS